MNSGHDIGSWHQVVLEICRFEKRRCRSMRTSHFEIVSGGGGGGGRGYLTFNVVQVSAPKGLTMGLKKLTTTEFGFLQNWISEQNVASWTNFFAQFQALKLNFFPNFETLECKISKALWFHMKLGSWGTETFWNGFLEIYQEGMKRDVKGSTYPYPIFRRVPPGIVSTKLTADLDLHLRCMVHL